MTSADFWGRKLGGQAPPPHVQQAPQPAPGAWWAPTPASSHLQVTPQADPSGQYPPPNYTYEQLKAMRASEMSQDQMELLAALELELEKYNNHCPQCQSTNFVRQGDRIGGVRMPTDKCFECGNSSSALTGSPEPAVGASGNRANSHHTRQTANGGAANGNYGRHHSEIPTNYLPRGPM